MRRSIRDLLTCGAISGWIAGTVVVVWFLAVDVAAGDALRTPLTLGEVLFGSAAASSPALAVLLYTILHFLTFLSLGMVMSAFLALTRLRPGWLIGLLFGVGVLDAVHYAGLLLTDVRVLNVLPWPHVVGANLLAGLASMTYLHGATRATNPFGLGFFRQSPVVFTGMGTGLVGAGALALWFFLLDIAAGAPFRTPAALGSALLLGAGAQSAQATPGIVLAYTLVHVAAFAVAGMVFVAVARQLERVPSLGYLVVLAFIVLESVSFGVLVSFGEWVLGDLSLWEIGVGNLLSVAAMAGWVWRSHPVLRARLAERGYASSLA
ncbi:MAG: hypothetical protein ACE5HQ_06165 [Gemmatimonadota bacterium]